MENGNVQFGDSDQEHSSGSDEFEWSVMEMVEGSNKFEKEGYSLMKGMGIRKFIMSETFTMRGYDGPYTSSPKESTLNIGNIEIQ